MSMTAHGAALPETISFEDFLSAYDGVRAEWVDGSVVPMSPASDRHQNVADFLTALMRYWAEKHRLGTVRSSQILMRLGKAARVPDVLFLESGNRERLLPNHLEGPADLVVEIANPESRGRDRGEKFYEYEQAGVREYWLIDPLRETAEIFRPDVRGRYAPAADGNSSRLRSEVLRGFWIESRWLWSEPMPTLESVLIEWGLIPG